MQLCRCDSFTPRGGGQRDRERFANLSLSLQHLSTHSGDTAAAGLITANRVVCTNIVCAIQVQVVSRHFDMVFGRFVFGLVSYAFQ